MVKQNFMMRGICCTPWAEFYNGTGEIRNKRMELKLTNKYNKVSCACCEYYTISEIAETCPICYWEENIYQEENQEDCDAPNYISLKEAKENFKIFGAKTLEFQGLSRKPFTQEL